MPGASTPAAPPRSAFTPSAASISSVATPPGRRMRTPSGPALTMVDSSPTGVGPPSAINPILSPRSSLTAPAVVALMRPDELAEGAASGRPSAAISSRAKPCGMRIATVSSPAVTSGGMP